MKRRKILLFLALSAACSRKSKQLGEILPERAGAWTRGPVESLTDVPPLLGELGVDEAVSTTYSGPAQVRVRAFRMRAETSAFEAIQKWRPQDGLATYKGVIFLVADPGGASRDAPINLLADLKQGMP